VNSKDKKALCKTCFYRNDSIRRVKEYIKRNPAGEGMVCDPAPKAECKWHTLYGEEENYQKTACFDYKELK